MPKVWLGSEPQTLIDTDDVSAMYISRGEDFQIILLRGVAQPIFIPLRTPHDAQDIKQAVEAALKSAEEA